MAEQKQYIPWLNSLRGVAILAVVLGHMASPLTGFIYSWHIPLFFFISGYLLKADTEVYRAIKKDISRLILPYFIFGLLGIAVEIVKRRLWPSYPFVYPSFSLTRELIGLIFWMDAAHIHNYGFVLWFLPALLWSKLFSQLLLRYVRQPLLVLSTALVFWFIMSGFHRSLPFSLDKGLISFIFVISGYYFRKYLDKIKDSWVTLGLGIPLLLQKPPVLDLAYKTIASPVINLLYALTIIFLLVSIFSKLSGKYFSLTFLGINSLFIYVIHPYINNISFLVISKWNMNWLLEFIISVIILLVLVILKKYVEKTHYAGIINWV